MEYDPLTARFVDDDAYVFPRTLEKRLAAEAAARGGAPTAEYLGVYHTPRVDLEWKDPRAHISCAAQLGATVAQFGATLAETPDPSVSQATVDCAAEHRDAGGPCAVVGVDVAAGEAASAT